MSADLHRCYSGGCAFLYHCTYSALTKPLLFPRERKQTESKEHQGSFGEFFLTTKLWLKYFPLRDPKV